MRIDQAVNIEDLHRMAKRRLPKIAFDFIEGGLEDERGLERNTSAFHKHQLLPHYLVDVSKRDQSASLFGRTYASPFGISPTGGAGLFRRGADLMLAEAAADANIPYIMSGSSNNSIEAAARVAPNNAWYQLYAANGANAEAVYNYSRSIMPYNTQTWRDLEQYRRLFPRNLVVKGIMDPRDALRCAEIGCDGIIVSNHGGRQLDQAPASLDVLPAIDEAVGSKLTVMLDSGVRRGADVLIALCHG